MSLFHGVPLPLFPPHRFEAGMRGKVSVRMGESLQHPDSVGIRRDTRDRCFRRAGWYDGGKSLLDSRTPSANRAGTFGMNRLHNMIPTN